MARPITPLLTTVSLAVLAGGPLHAYELKKRIEMGLGRLLTVSEGSLYPLLRSVESEGLLVGQVEQAIQGRPDRVVYELTEAGRDELHRRLGEPLMSGNLGQMDFYVRVACFHLIDKATRRTLIADRRALLHEERDRFLSAKDAIREYPGHLDLADLRELQLNTELMWLDSLEHSVGVN